MGPRRVTVLLCGEAARGDDGVAFTAGARLADAPAPLADLRSVGQLDPDDLVHAPGPIVVVDAVRGPAPGTIVDLPLANLGTAPWTTPTGGRSMAAASSHALPLETVVAIAARLRASPLEGRFVGLAGADFELGAPLSDVVTSALPRLVDRLADWIEVLSEDDARPAEPAPARGGSRTGPCA